MAKEQRASTAKSKEADENQIRLIKTKEDFLWVCKNTQIPQEVFQTFDGMDFLIFMNEFRRITEGVELTRVKTYSYRLNAPRCHNYYIGYFVDIHNATLKVNRNWLDQGMDEDWWKVRVTKIMTTVATWLKRIFYMNEYEEKERQLAEMRKVLGEKGIEYIDDEEYQAAFSRKLKYADP